MTVSACLLPLTATTSQTPQTLESITAAMSAATPSHSSPARPAGLPAAADIDPLEVAAEGPAGGSAATFAKNEVAMMRDAALSYAKKGFRVVPVHSMVAAPDGGIECSCMRWERKRVARWAGESGMPYQDPPQCTQPAKHPRIAWKEKKRYPAVQVRRMWDGPQKCANIGLVTGSDTGLFVIDIDGEEGAANLVALEAEHGPLPPTPAVITGSGGRHYYFFYDGPEIPNSASYLGPKIDTRGQSGLIFAPPSNHKSSRRYEWAEGLSLDDVPLAPLPAWVSGKLNQRKAGATGDSAPRKTTGAGAKRPGSAENGESADVHGVEARLAFIGDGPDMGGFNGPIYSAMCALIARDGADADNDSILDPIRERIAEAPRDAN